MPKPLMMNSGEVSNQRCSSRKYQGAGTHVRARWESPTIARQITNYWETKLVRRQKTW